MAVVYRARDLMLERSVAVKLLREDFSRDPVFQERFRREARAAANLSHPNIVTVHDFGLDHGQLFLVMEYVPGQDLKAALRKRGRFSAEEALPLIVQACAGIGYAHRAGLVHCDVKPQNMLVTPDLRLKVADFGIARALASIRPDEQSEVVWGSPQYFAPEQASGAAPSPASDVYSLGVILYEMLAGELPFQATNADDLARLHMEARPPDIRTKVPAISPDLEQVLLKVLSKEPAQRYRTADQLGRILNNLIPMDKAPALALTPEAARVPPGNVRTLRPTQGSALRPTQESSFRPAQDSTLEKTPPRAVPHLPEPALSIDFLSVGLGLLALVTVLGLIPFWVWVYFVYNPPIR
jgi:serine/threonine-protein kinase